MVGSILQNFTMKRALRRLNEFQTACKSILPKVDPLLVEDMILHQQRNPDELTVAGTQKMLRKISLQTQEWCHQYVSTGRIT